MCAVTSKSSKPAVNSYAGGWRPAAFRVHTEPPGCFGLRCQAAALYPQSRFGWSFENNTS